MSKIHKPWVSHEELDAFLGGGVLDTLPHASDHEVGGGDLLDLAEITGATVKLTDLTDGYVPYHVSDAAGLANSPIFIDTAKVFINETINTKMTKGLTIQQDGEDDEALALKSLGDVAHGMTDQAETDTYGFWGKSSADSGGLKISGFTEGVVGVRELGFYTTDDTTKTVAGRAAIEAWAAKRSGTNYGNVGADANIFAMRCYVSDAWKSRWILDEDGDTWQPGIVTAESFHLLAGVEPNLGWLSDVVLGTLEEGETISYDQATAKWIDAWGIDYDNPRLVYKFYTDFFSADSDTNDPWVGAVLGAGSLAAVTGTANHPGIVKFDSAGGNTGDGYRFMTSTSCILIAGAEHSEFCFKTPASLTAVRIRLGYQDSLTDAAPTDGVFIDIAATVLAGKTYNNTANSTTGTNYVIAVNTWYRGKIAVNSDATEIVFILYSAVGVVLWTDTLAANIPTVAGRELGHGAVAWVGNDSSRDLISLDMMIATRAGYIIR